MKSLQEFLLSFFYIGFIPKAPGTFGSLAAIPLIYLLSLIPFSYAWYLPALILLVAVVSIITNIYQKTHHLHDPQWIVIDEVLGMLTAWSFLPSFNLQSILVLFISFRIFDITKVWPVSYFDKMNHGAGTILDDVVAGIYAGFVLRACFFFQVIS